MIADDHPVVREGLASLINRQPDMEVVAEASDGMKAVETYNQCHPDLAVIDLRMPKMDGVQVTTAILKKTPGARIVILSTYDGDENIYQSLRAGAQGYLRKDATREALLECLHTVYEGRPWIEPAIAGKLAKRMRELDLSPRELEVLRLMVAGKINKEIADLLNISEGTVKIHVNHLMRKLGVRGRTEAMNAALKRGIVQID